MKNDGTTMSVTRAQIAAGQIPGVAPSDFDAAAAQAQGNKRSLALGGQYEVVGLNADGSMMVRNMGTGVVSPITAAQVAAGQVPGVTTSMFDQAVASQQSTQKALTQGGQWSFHSLSQTPGMVWVQNNGTGQLQQVSQQDASDPSKFPGVNPLEIQQAQTQQTETNWQQASAFGPQFPTTPTAYTTSAPLSAATAASPVMSGATPPAPALAQTATTQATTQTTSAPSPAPSPGGTRGGGVTPGVTPTPTPTPTRDTGATAPTGAVSPTPTPTRAIGAQQQAQYQASAPSAPSGYASTSVGINAGNAGSMTNQQLSLANQTYGNLQNYIRDSNVGNRNLSGMGWSGIGKPAIAGQS